MSDSGYYRTAIVECSVTSNADKEAVLEKLREIRTKTDIKLRPSQHLRDEVWTGRNDPATGMPVMRPFALRNYQKQMVSHLLAMGRFVVGDDMGLGKCVRKGTLILTNNGMVPIEDLAPSPDQVADTFVPVTGWSVATPAGLRPVKNFYYGGVKPTVRVRTRYGFDLEGSRVHPIFVSRPEGEGWVRLPDVREGDYACIDRTTGGFPDHEPNLPAFDPATVGHTARPISFPSSMTPDLARLLGYIVSEGLNSNPDCVPITQHKDKNSEVYEDIVGLCEKFWPGLARISEEGVALHSVALRKWLTRIGVSPTVSKGQVVPWSVLTATRESVVAFLRAFMDANGSVGSGIEVSSASEALLRQIQLLLLRLGIIAKRRAKPIKGRTHVYWRLTVFGDDAREYEAQVGMVSLRKQEALHAVTERKANPNHDLIPHPIPLVEGIRAAISAQIGRKGISTRWGSSFFLSNIRFGRAGLTFGFARRLLAVAAEVGVNADAPEVMALAQRLDRRFFYDPVVEIEEGEAEVMDVEVDDPAHLFIGNGFVNHNTVETIAALAYLWDKKAAGRVFVLTKKSSVPQWEDEIKRFTQGVLVFVVKGPPAKREAVFQQFMALPDDVPAVLIQGYASACQDFGTYSTILDRIDPPTFIMDEATAFKTPTTRVHKVCAYLAGKSKRCWALTGTLIKNSLIEGYGIFKVVHPPLFPTNLNGFIAQFCLTRMQRVAGGRQVPVVVGYRGDDVRRFRDLIDPFYLGRPKHAVATELPVLTTQDIAVDLYPNQASKYKEALTGLLEVGTGEEKETTQLTAIIYCQEIANHLGLIDFPDEPSSKLDALLDLLSEGDFATEKVIVFTRFKRLVDLAIPVLAKAGIKCVRVTGDENEDQRRDAMRAFQDPDSGTNVIWITMAGGDAINLQAAKAIVFFDSPWSAGDYLQILGRMIRIGSEHDRCYAIHLMARGTVDQRVQEVLAKKMGLVEAVLGRRLVSEGGVDSSDSLIYDTTSEVKELFNGLMADAQSLR